MLRSAGAPEAIVPAHRGCLSHCIAELSVLATRPDSEVVNAEDAPASQVPLASSVSRGSADMGDRGLAEFMALTAFDEIAQLREDEQ